MNRDSYNAIAEAWDEARRSFYGREREYVDALLDGLPAAAPILDLGCGTGRPIAEYVLSKGHRLTGVDQAEQLLLLARKRYPQAAWIQAAIETFDTNARFDAIVCWDALFHVERWQHERVVARFARWLRPGGRLMLTFGGSAHPAFTDTMFGETFFYDSHPPEEMLRILAATGFAPRISEFMNLPGENGDKGRYAVVATLGHQA